MTQSSIDIPVTEVKVGDVIESLHLQVRRLSILPSAEVAMACAIIGNDLFQDVPVILPDTATVTVLRTA